MSSPLAPRIRQLAAAARDIRESTAPSDGDGSADRGDGGADRGDADGDEACGDGDDGADSDDADRDEAGGDGDCVERTPLSAARDGLGPVLAVYVEARACDESVRFSQEELDLLHQATNDWLVVYARQRGVDVDPDATVREAAGLLVDTHDVAEVAAQLVGLPPK